MSELESARVSDVLSESLTQVRLADEVGLDSVWISEHHFLENGQIGSVLSFAAAIGAVTKQIRVSVYALAPRYDPVDLAENAVFLDQLTSGRFNLGLILGYRDVEYEGFGVRRTQRVGRLEELVEILRQAWSDGEISFDGRNFRRSGIAVYPKPFRKQGIPIFLGGHHPNAIDRAARLADALIMDAATDSDVFTQQGHNRDVYSRVENTFALYREARRRHGKDTQGIPFYIVVGGFLSEHGGAAAWKAVREAYMETRRTYGRWYGIEEQVWRRWYPDLMSSDELNVRRGEIWVGSPDELLPRFQRLQQIVGDGLHVIFRMKYPGVGPTETRTSIRLLGQLRNRLQEGG